MGEKEGRNTRVLSLFVRLSYGDILKKKEEARHYQVTERTIQRDLETIRSVLEEERKMGRDDRMLLYDREQNGYKICRVYLSREDSHFCKYCGADCRCFITASVLLHRRYRHHCPVLPVQILHLCRMEMHISDSTSGYSL